MQSRSPQDFVVHVAVFAVVALCLLVVNLSDAYSARKVIGAGCLDIAALLALLPDLAVFLRIEEFCEITGWRKAWVCAPLVAVGSYWLFQP